MKKFLPLFLYAVLLFSACGNVTPSEAPSSEPTDEASTDTHKAENSEDVSYIELSDDGIIVDGSPISTDIGAEVYAARDIVFYLAGQPFTYGEGTEADEHTQAEADEHTVVHITSPGTYSISGTLSAGQIAVDLGEDAEDDPNAVVTLILDDVAITCTVAPAVIFYNVYECGDKDNPTKDVDTSAAGARVIIADDSTNTVNGSYVARIYKSYELSEDGTEVIDSKKLHKYDGAFYSKMSMNVDGDSGVLNINAENEGLDSELHLTINGGKINIISGNDGINTNEDGVSVTTINGGDVYIRCDASTGEGDGIDSNGWLVINDGTVIAEACAISGDSGIDSDMGIHINGGTVVATGNMLDRIESGGQTYAVFSFKEQQSGGTYTLKNSNAEDTFTATATNSFTIMLVSYPELLPGTYSFWNDSAQLSATTGNMGGGMMGGFGGGMIPSDTELPEGMEIPEGADDMAPPEGFENTQRPELPEGEKIPEIPETPDGTENMPPPDGLQDGGQLPDRKFENTQNAVLSADFIITEGANYFSAVSPLQ